MKPEEIIKENAEYYKDVFCSAKGLKVLEDLKSFCGFERSSVCEQEPNALQTMYCEGKRRVYLRILSLIKKAEGKK